MPGQIRLVGCTGSRRAWRVTHCAARQLPPQALQDGRLQQFDVIAGALRDLVKEAGAGRRIAIAVPEESGRRKVLAVPASLRPWDWRRWLRQQAEQLLGMPADALVFDVQMLNRKPLEVMLTACPREVVEDWQGLAEAAGLDLVLLDERARVMRMALGVLDMVPATGGAELLAEAGASRCRVHRWQAGRAPRFQDLGGELRGGDDNDDAAPGVEPVTSRWWVGDGPQAQRWVPELQAWAGAPWSAVGLRTRLRWPEGSADADADVYLAALGLALRQWHL
jgi:Tfp pilus assembly PilM family ATPase